MNLDCTRGIAFNLQSTIGIKETQDDRNYFIRRIHSTAAAGSNGHFPGHVSGDHSGFKNTLEGLIAMAVISTPVFLDDSKAFIHRIFDRGEVAEGDIGDTPTIAAVYRGGYHASIKDRQSGYEPGLGPTVSRATVGPRCPGSRRGACPRVGQRADPGACDDWFGPTVAAFWDAPLAFLGAGVTPVGSEVTLRVPGRRGRGCSPHRWIFSWLQPWLRCLT